MSPESPDISIITVNYNGGAVLRAFAEHILDNIKCSYEVVVYDNASPDSSIELLPESLNIKAIAGPENLGFAKGNNKAAAAARGEWLHFLNPDILVNKQLDEDYGRIIATGKRGKLYVTSLVDDTEHAQQMQMLIPTLDNYFRRAFAPRKAKYWSIGASIVMHRDTFEQLGGWSEAYFMYSEDLDLFYTAQRMGIEVVHLDTRIVHIGKVSSQTVWGVNKRAEVIEKSLKTFYRRHRSTPEYVVVRLLQFAYQLVIDRAALKSGARAFAKLLFK